MSISLLFAMRLPAKAHWAGISFNVLAFNVLEVKQCLQN